MADAGNISSSQIVATLGSLYTKGAKPAQYSNNGFAGYSHLTRTNESLMSNPNLYSNNRSSPHDYHCQTRVLACDVVNGPNVHPSVNVHNYGAVYGDCNNCHYMERKEL